MLELSSHHIPSAIITASGKGATTYVVWLWRCDGGPAAQRRRRHFFDAHHKLDAPVVGLVETDGDSPP